MPQVWTLRRATAADSEFLYRVYASTRIEELAPTGWNDAQMEAFLRMQFDAQGRHYRTHYPNAEYYVIESAASDVGRFYVDHSANEIRVMDIALLSPYRGRGLGGALMRATLKEAADSGRIVSIHVERNNAALRLYLRLGFVEVDEYGIYKLMRWRSGRVDEPCNALRNESSRDMSTAASQARVI